MRHSDVIGLMRAACLFSSMSSWFSALIWFAAASLGPAHEPVTPAPRPVLVELFTSQGCPLCPAANQYLGELDQRDDVIALGYGVSYWDFYGWEDTYARPEFVERQQVYRDSLDVPRIYTPQFVIDGSAEASGVETDAIRSALERRRMAMPASVEVSTEALGDGNHRIRVVGSMPSDQSADVWLVVFQPGWQVVEIESGNNAGLDMRLYNPVQALLDLGEWKSGVAFFGASLPEGSSAVVIVQAPNGGPVYGAAQFARDPVPFAAAD